MTDTPTVTVTPEPAPGPGGRVGRTAGQVGGVVTIIDLWLAFGWLGADDWTERQVLAVSAVAYLVVSAGHNLVNWWHRERNRAVPPTSAVTVEAVDARPQRKRNESGAVHWPTVAAAVVVVLLILILL